MAKLPTTKSTSARTQGIFPWRKASNRTRRTDLRKTMGHKQPQWRLLLSEKAFLYAAACVLVVAAVSSILVVNTRDSEWLRPGDIANETRVVRAGFSILDKDATEQAKEDARRKTALRFRPDEGRLQEIADALRELPTHLAKYESFDDLESEIKEQYNLDKERFAAVRSWSSQGDRWIKAVNELVGNVLLTWPIISEEDYSLVFGSEVALIRDNGQVQRISVRRIRLANGKPEEVRVLAQAAGFTGPSVDVVAYRIAQSQRPTFIYAEAATHAAREEAANQVKPVYEEHRVDEILYRRGEKVTDTQLALAKQEQATYRAGLSGMQKLAGITGQAGVTFFIIMALVGYLAYFHPEVLRDSLRFGVWSLMWMVMLLLACSLAVADPNSIYLTGIGPVLLLGMVMVIAHGQRVALTVTSMFALLVTLALHQSLGFYLTAVLGTSLAVWQLREIRQRNTIMRAGIIAAGGLGAATLIIGLLERPLVPGIMGEITTDAALAALSGLVVGLFVLGVLPTIERVFDVTTGLKLIELRDSKQPLLRELQQRAPGTFNHSLTIASMAEDAAEAIGADPLLTYVGGLYHDIGKMNKPAYFIENQGSGYNKHAKLRPAMSLLVIVGHVKDGIELARQFGLPKPVLHFIESHHGTTLVEYFYHAAREEAASDPEKDEPSEVEYRYPGPKPRTREAAILMLCDCVESATRAMADPTPARIESLVHSLARKRLLDGQFDDCDLTLRDLYAIEESIIKSTCALYHGRISYPESKESRNKEQAREEKTATA
ncbi:MAG TPA: HDIG domain-containing protein [Phycisphaeraceae bacterium]|nr:HDIG domain-containing protein [Phycisphaeraceae bacterium]